MKIHELNKQITIQAPSYTPDAQGGFDETYSDVATVWAKAWTTSSDDQTRTQKFQIRFRRVLRPEWRIKYGDNYFSIVGVDPDEKNEFLFITCKGVV